MCVRSQRLAIHRITSAPVIEPSTNTFLGFLDIADILSTFVRGTPLVV
jgi:hypothetical protein